MNHVGWIIQQRCHAQELQAHLQTHTKPATSSSKQQATTSTAMVGRSSGLCVQHRSISAHSGADGHTACDGRGRLIPDWTTPPDSTACLQATSLTLKRRPPSHQFQQFPTVRRRSCKHQRRGCTRPSAPQVISTAPARSATLMALAKHAPDPIAILPTPQHSEASSEIMLPSFGGRR